MKLKTENLELRLKQATGDRATAVNEKAAAERELKEEKKKGATLILQMEKMKVAEGKVRCRFVPVAGCPVGVRR